MSVLLFIPIVLAAVAAARQAAQRLSRRRGKANAPFARVAVPSPRPLNPVVPGRILGASPSVRGLTTFALCGAMLLGTGGLASPGTAAAFTLYTDPIEASTKSATISIASGPLIRCAAGSSFAAIVDEGAGPIGEAVLALEDCELVHGLVRATKGTACTVPGYGSGEIFAYASVSLGALAGAPGHAGWGFSLEYTPIACGAETLSLSGSVVGRVSPTKKPLTPAKTATFSFKATAGVERDDDVAGGVQDTLELGGQPAGLTMTAKGHFVKPIAF